MSSPPNLRPELARHLSQRLEAFSDGFRHNLALIGPPGSGKSFQLQQLVAAAPNTLTLISCSLYRESCRSFLTRLLGATLQAGCIAVGQRQAFGVPDRNDSTTDQWLVPAQPLEQMVRTAEPVLPNTAAAIRTIEPLVNRRSYAEAFTRTLDTIPVLAEELRQPTVLILDEFLYLEELGLGHAFHELGKRVMTWPSTLFILSSSATYRARAILRERLQLLFGQFELLTLESLEPSTASEWVHQALVGIRRADMVSPFLLRWLGAYPWYLTLFLKRFKELAALGHRFDEPEHLFLQTAWDLLGSPEGPLHQWCVSRIESLVHARSGARALDTLIHVAGGARTATEIGSRIGRAGLSTALQALVEHDLVQRNGSCWLVTDPVVRCWLSSVLLARRTNAQSDETLVRHRFEQYLRSLWVHWEQLHQLSFSEQVVHLFERFDDETVWLDSKTGRLPKFDSIRTEWTANSAAYIIADGGGRRWCATVQERAVAESDISSFERFCRSQQPKPSRKVVITRTGLDQNARLLAKTSNMWVWQPSDLSLLAGLYGAQHR